MGRQARILKYTDILFVAAVAAMLVGAALLTLTTGFVRRGFEVWPLGMTAVGVILVYVTVTFGKKSGFFFSGMALSVTGVILVVMYAAGWSLFMTWPLFMVGIGASMLPAGYRRYRSLKAVYLVPAVLFALLGGFFMLFSFRIVHFTLKRFVSVWWPLVFVMAAIVLFVMYAHNRARFARPPRESR
ncbi:MAG: hypothetical protein NT080_04135 [Spirochaetes bacterium]|nr:hypothetical protein [Spirochaetota bacterium]